jgi:hypothetical protein
VQVPSWLSAEISGRELVSTGLPTTAASMNALRSVDHGGAVEHRSKKSSLASASTGCAPQNATLR